MLFLSLSGCIDLPGRERENGFDVSKTVIEGEYDGKNTRNESVIRISKVENSPPAEDVYALLHDPNGTYMDWHAFGENPGRRHPISAITTIGGQWCDENEDITWLDYYEDHLLRADEEFYISNELVPPDAEGFKFILEYKNGKILLEVEIEPAETNGNVPKPIEGTLEDIDFYIEITNTTLVDGKFNVTCCLKNTGKNQVTISGPGLGFPTLDFFIYTPENTIVHYLGPWVRCRCLPGGIGLQPDEYYNWTSTIGSIHQIWGVDNQEPYVESFVFKPGNFAIYGNYSSSINKSGNFSTLNGWTHSNLINFTLKDSTSTPIEQLKCKPKVIVTGTNYTSNPSSVPYHDVHAQFSSNYTGANLCHELRNLTMESMKEQVEKLGENSTILYESIKVTYSCWEERPYRIPCYAEKALYKSEWIWAIAFNRANGFEDRIEHFDLYFVSISTIEAQYIHGCNSTAVIFHTGCY